MKYTLINKKQKFLQIEKKYNKAKIDTMQEATELRTLVRSTIDKVAPPS